MMKELIITGEGLKTYFGSDADALLQIAKGIIYGIELLVDTEKKHACYVYVTEKELKDNIRNGIYIDDDYEGVLDYLIQDAMTKYENIRDEIFLVRACGDLSKLCNLRNEFDETFDYFFDQAELRKKYNAWDFEENQINTDITNADLSNMLDDDDKLKYLKYIEDRINILQEYIDGLGE